MNQYPKAVLVGGKFDDDGGRPSGVIRKLYDSMITNGLTPLGSDFLCRNGGNFRELEQWMKEVVPTLSKASAVNTGRIKSVTIKI